MCTVLKRNNFILGESTPGEQIQGYVKSLSCYFLKCLEPSINEQIIGKKYKKAK